MSKTITKKFTCYLLSFIVPVIFMLIISIGYGFAPFGKTSILMADMRYQFVDYYGYLKYIFFGNEDFFYNFSKTFGGDMLGFSSYYLNSIPNLLLLLFPNEYLPEGILLMGTLLIGLSGLTFNIMLNKLYSVRWASLIFSTAYAFMGFFLAYFNCTHYFFNLMLLPLIILGLCTMVKNGRVNILYVISLFLAVFSNYYIGYMTCLFSVIFFVYYVLTETPSLKIRDLSQYVKAFFSYVLASLIAVGMSAFTLITVVFSLSGQKSGVGEADLSLSRNFKMIDVFSGLYNTAFHGNISDGLPIIYCGVATVVFVLLFLLNKKVSLKERIVSLLALTVVLSCFYINALNIIWHGFNSPIGFPYRDSFFFSFLLLFTGYKGFISTASGTRPYQGIICLGVYAVYSAYMLLSNNAYVGMDQVVISGVIMVITLFFVYGFRNKKEYVIPLVLGLFLLQGADLLYNGYISIGGYFADLDENPGDYSADAFRDFVKNNRAVINGLSVQDPGFYRIEKMYRRSHNDAMLLGYKGLSHFSSCETEQVKNFMESLGFRNNDNWAFYGYGSTSFADSLMGMKYLLAQYDEIAKPYPQFKNQCDIYVFKNPFTLPLAFGMKDDVLSVSEEGNDKFSYQNQIADAFTSKDYEIYRSVKQGKTVLVNVEENGHNYTRLNQTEDAYISYKLKVDSEDFIYMYFDAPLEQATTIVIDGLEKEPYFTSYGWCIREAGHFKPGQDIEVRIYLNQNTVTINQASFYYEDSKELAKWYNDAVDGLKVSVDEVSSSHLRGTFESKDADYMVMTIPYETSWSITLDGKSVKQVKVMDGLTAVPVTPGKHNFEMKYVPKGFKEGMVVSILSLIGLIVVAIYNKKKLKSYSTR